MNIFNIIQVMMAQKKHKWNISQAKGEELVHRYITEILQGSKHNMIPLSDLMILLNQRTKHIKFIHHSKKKPLSVYIRCTYGNIVNFLDKFATYGLLRNNSDIQVKLMNHPLLNEWILVDEDDFILV